MLRSKMFSIFYTPVHTSVQGKNRNNTVLYLAGNFINIGLKEDDADLHFFISRSGFEKKRALKHLYTKAWLQLRALVHE